MRGAQIVCTMQGEKVPPSPLPRPRELVVARGESEGEARGAESGWLGIRAGGRAWGSARPQLTPPGKGRGKGQGSVSARSRGDRTVLAAPAVSVRPEVRVVECGAPLAPLEGWRLPRLREGASRLLDPKALGYTRRLLRPRAGRHGGARHRVVDLWPSAGALLAEELVDDRIEEDARDRRRCAHLLLELERVACGDMSRTCPGHGPGRAPLLAPGGMPSAMAMPTMTMARLAVFATDAVTAPVALRWRKRSGEMWGRCGGDVGEIAP